MYCLSQTLKKRRRRRIAGGEGNSHVLCNPYVIQLYKAERKKIQNNKKWKEVKRHMFKLLRSRGGWGLEDWGGNGRKQGGMGRSGEGVREKRGDVNGETRKRGEERSGMGE